MRYLKTRRRRLLGVLAAFSLAAAACGGGSGGAGETDLSGATIAVGSKEFTEQLILGQMAILLLEDAGANVVDRTGIQGTTNVRKALTSDEIDMYWEYTGTGWIVHLGHTASQAPKDTQKLYEQVAEEDLKKNNVKWLPPADVNNTYAIATAEGRGKKLGVSNLSDYAKLAEKSPQKASMCAATEFLTRDDGLPGLEKTYGFSLPRSATSQVALGVVYTQVPKGKACNFGEVFATDGRIIANNLEIIEDDKNFFVKYNVAMTMRQDIYKQYPQLAKLFKPLTQKLTTEKMRQLNAKVDVQGQLPDQVAEEFLQNNGLID